ncbi:hypothetical protein Q73A0000_07705 [Kaistella flava (ex Peng et al. 2021)]|uniref:Cytochrome c n=1 Tax=Kaistella flava (ex Peng et al. 2021) TaxID=2038776 RepID=A0A7M2Y7L7_9FLAO|nr:hypothetical protein [Kaistella flava (ex Peng et al. 2021)]QOW10258.1 hypothetical protein Q73A0000_07705 [Kaistella flava (ex Peng et al. 2021)]
MKQIFPILFSIALISCNQQTDQTQLLQKRVDSLEHQLAETYKPGFGEFMSGIQVHHNKLWFAGENENWKLADFEIHEIMEAIDNIKKYQKERKESEMIDMLNPALDSLNNAIKLKNPKLFKSSFITLTNTCNQCHRQTQFEFNVVKIPDQPPFSNQDFRKQLEKK